MQRFWSIESLALAVNVIILVGICMRQPIEPGKILYWAGGTILMVGVVLMKG